MNLPGKNQYTSLPGFIRLVPGWRSVEPGSTLNYFLSLSQSTTDLMSYPIKISISSEKEAGVMSEQRCSVFIEKKGLPRIAELKEVF